MITLCLPYLISFRVTKMVFSSSLMEASFFTIAQRQALIKARLEQEKREQIDSLNKVGGMDYPATLNTSVISNMAGPDVLHFCVHRN